MSSLRTGSFSFSSSSHPQHLVRFLTHHRVSINACWINWVCTARSCLPRRVFNGTPVKWGSGTCAWWFSCFVSCPIAASVPGRVRKSRAPGGSCYIGSLEEQGPCWGAGGRRPNEDHIVYLAASFTGSVGLCFGLPSPPDLAHQLKALLDEPTIKSR